jgi:hypothetical protein
MKLFQALKILGSSTIQTEPNDPADGARFEKALHPWRYVRNRSSIAIRGVSGSIAASLPNVMTSTEPFPDLVLAMNSLRTYMRGIMTPAFLGSNSPNADLVLQISRVQARVCNRAVSKDDAALFIRGRNRILSLLAQIVTTQEAKGL